MLDLTSAVKWANFDHFMYCQVVKSGIIPSAFRLARLCPRFSGWKQVKNSHSGNACCEISGLGFFILFKKIMFSLLLNNFVFLSVLLMFAFVYFTELFFIFYFVPSLLGLNGLNLFFLHSLSPFNSWLFISHLCYERRLNEMLNSYISTHLHSNL